MARRTRRCWKYVLIFLNDLEVGQENVVGHVKQVARIPDLRQANRWRIIGRLRFAVIKGLWSQFWIRGQFDWIRQNKLDPDPVGNKTFLFF